MVLRVVPVPNPPPGVDWFDQVPGQYVYDVISITAQLDTSAAVGTVCADSSGNGFDGTYQSTVPPQQFVPGVLTDDVALDIGPARGSIVQIPPTPHSLDNDRTLNFWIKRAIGTTGVCEIWNATDTVSGDTLHCACNYGTGNNVAFGDQISDWFSADDVLPDDGAWHMVSVTLQGSSTVTFYVDGLPVANGAAGDPIFFGPVFPTQSSLAALPDFTPSGLGALDEFAQGTEYISTDADIAAVFAAATDLATYTAAVLAHIFPDEYYHLDGSAAGGGRQSTLAITNGTVLVEQLCTGFAEAVSGTSFQYTWQVGVVSSSQSPDGTVTLAGLPRLVLPAGYVIGALTLDLQPGDQWSNVQVWWSDDQMPGTIDELLPYDYHSLLLLQRP